MNSDKLNPLRLVIKSDLNELQNIEKITEELINKMSFSDEDRDSIAISVTEVVSNAITHGNKNQKNKNVIIDLIPTKNGLTITVKDEGNGFNLNDIANPIDPENLLKESGRGIYIVRALMDKLEFDVKKSGTIVKMEKRIKRKK